MKTALFIFLDDVAYTLRRLEADPKFHKLLWEMRRADSEPRIVTVNLHGKASCDCPAFVMRPSRGPCKHLRALSSEKLLPKGKP